MDHIKILRRALNITINYRALWVFGFLLALTTGINFGNGGGGRNGSSPTNNLPTVPPEVASAWMGIAIGLGCLILVLIVVGIIVRYVSETALIRMVDEHEKSGERLTVRQGFRLGWSRRAGKMFLMDLLVGLGFIIAFLLLLAVAALPLLVWLTQSTPLHVIGSVISGGLLLLLVFAAILTALAVTLILIFARRACALEDLGVRASLRRGYAMIRQRLGDLVLMGVMMFGIELLLGLATFLVMLAVIVAAALIAGLPALLVGSIAGLFTQGAAPWIIAGIVGVPIFLVAVIVPVALIGGWKQAFSGSVWTLTYRETLALEQTKTNGEPPAVESAAQK